MMTAEVHGEVQRLTAEARIVLKQLGAAHAALPFAAEAAGRLRPEFLCRAEQELALHELRQGGMLELRQKVWGERLYQIPQQRFPQIQRSLWAVSPQPLAGAGVWVEYEACTGLAGELFRALVYTAREGLPLTAKGTIHKKQLSGLAGQLAMRKEHLTGLGLQLPGAENDPLPVMVIVDLMAVLGLISRQSSGYLLDRERLGQWLAQSEQEMTDTLYRIAINRYGCSAPAVQHFRHLISAAEFPPNEWFAVRPILEWMSDSGLAREQGQAAAETAEAGLYGAALAWLRCLAGFGWCELGYTPGGEPCFRWRTAKPLLAGDGSEVDAQAVESGAAAEANAGPDGATGGAGPELFEQPAAGGDAVTAREADAGRSLLAESGGPEPEPAAGGFIVQPDFEVLVPPEVPYSIRWTLAAYAVLLHNEGLWSFRLTRELQRSAAEQGCPPEEGIAWLAAHALGGLPEQVELSLKQWARGIGRTALTEVILLSCAGLTEGDDIASHPRLQDILTRIGPLHFIVQPEGLTRLRKELAASGMAPPRIVGGREAAQQPYWFEPFTPQAAMVRYELPSPAEVRGLPGLAVPPQQLPLAAGDAEPELLPGEAAVPQMWLSQWRQYHATTAQKVMEQALSWGIKVRISRQGQTADFIPERISGRPWSVRGLLLQPGSDMVEEIQLTAEDWQEIKLLHPVRHRNSSSAGAGGYVMIR